MHELSVAQSLLEQAVTAAERNDADRIDRLNLAVGDAAHLNPDQLARCLETIALETCAADAVVVVDTVAPEGVCDCGWEGEPEALADVPMAAPDLHCPECNDRVELTAGKECRLTSISVPETAEN